MDRYGLHPERGDPPGRVRSATMDPANACPRCGSARLANAPAGLCPRCLLGHGLQAAGPPRPSGVLSMLGETLGPVPRVLLRDASTGEERPARVTSEGMPVAVGDAG